MGKWVEYNAQINPADNSQIKMERRIYEPFVFLQIITPSPYGIVRIMLTDHEAQTVANTLLKIVRESKNSPGT